MMFGILGTTLAVLGFLGNTLSILVLKQREMRSSTSYYLISLAVYDNFILLGMTLYFDLIELSRAWGIQGSYRKLISLTQPVGYPLSLSAQMGSIYTCVVFTMERFFAVCRPLHNINTDSRTKTIRVILAVFVCTMIYNIPRYFEYTLVCKSCDLPTNKSEILVLNCSHTNEDIAAVDTYSIRNLTEQMAMQNCTPSSNTVDRSLETSYQLNYTSFHYDNTFRHIYLIWCQLIFMFLIPFVSILVMNTSLIRAVNQSQAMLQTMSASANREHNLTVMLIAVIVVFLICQFGTIIDNILVALDYDKGFNYQVRLSYLFYCVCVCVCVYVWTG